MVAVRAASIALLAVFLPLRLGAAPERPYSVTEKREPCAEFHPLRHPYFGDTHVHTAFSQDASTQGTRNTPWDAYRFARGQSLGIQPYDDRGRALRTVKLARPLDFAAVTDHSEYLGVLRATEPDLPLNRRSLRDRLLHDGRLKNTLMLAQSLLGFDLEDAIVPGWQDISRSAWSEIIATAQRHNDPGRFTTFIGYEWSSMPGERNLHRNIIYRSAEVPPLPYSSVESEDPRDLWTALEQQREQGMESFAIPHNGNVSDGLMYDSVMYDGSAMDADYAERRMRNEPLSEIFEV